MASNPTVYHVIPNAVTEQWLLVEENGRLRQEFGTKEEALKGSLAVGKLADITILSKDILTVPDDEIMTTEVVSTIVGGAVAYQQ